MVAFEQNSWQLFTSRLPFRSWWERDYNLSVLEKRLCVGLAPWAGFTLLVDHTSPSKHLKIGRDIVLANTILWFLYSISKFTKRVSKKLYYSDCVVELFVPQAIAADELILGSHSHTFGFIRSYSRALSPLPFLPCTLSLFRCKMLARLAPVVAAIEGRIPLPVA